MGISGSYTFGDRETSGSGSGGGDALFTRTPENIVYDGEGSGAVSSSLHFGNSWAIGGRLGYLVTDGTLLFGTGGYTQMKTELKSRFSGSGGAGYTELSEDYGIDAEYAIGSSRSEWLGGYYLGAGLEQILWENFSLKFEYRFADYGSIDTSAEAGAGDFINCGNGCWRTSVEAEADVVDHSLMATVSFRM
jgi:outer membrane immunogenic protein